MDKWKKILNVIWINIPNYFKLGKNYRRIFNNLKNTNYKLSEKEQLNKLNEILCYCNEYVLYYRKIFKSIDLELPLEKLSDIKKIPILTKDDIRENFKELLSNDQKLTFYISNTGGSTGTPLKLYQSKSGAIIEQAFLDYYLLKYGINNKKKIIKVILRGTIPKNGIFEKQGKIYIFSSYLISKENINKYIKEIESIDPELIHVYPSSIYLLANLIKRMNLKINLSKLKVIISSSEIFALEQKKIVQEVFKVPILDWYGNTECTVLGIEEDIDKGYYFDDRYSYVELINNQIITTGYNNLKMPLIRYNTGDEIINENSRMLIKGRAVDYIIGENNIKIPMVGIIFGQHFKCFEKINKFQIYQDKIGEIIFYIEKEKISKKEEEEILKKLEIGTEKQIKIKIEYIDKIERTSRGKFKVLDQRLKF